MHLPIEMGKEFQMDNDVYQKLNSRFQLLNNMSILMKKNKYGKFDQRELTLLIINMQQVLSSIDDNSCSFF